jgi:hypothetical protein
MHHENELSPEIQKLMQEMAEREHFGATGKYPGGKLTSHDEGELAFGVTAYHGKVIVSFGKPVASLGMSPDEARRLALALRKRANEIERNPDL